MSIPKTVWGPSSAGTLMSEAWTASHLDAGQLFSMSPARAVCGLAAGVAFCAWWVTQSWVAVAIASLGVLGALGGPRRGGVDLLMVGLAFVSRSRWTRASVQETGGLCEVRARGVAISRLCRLEHRGRFDLSNLQDATDVALADVLDRVGSGPSTETVTWHSAATSEMVSVLSVPRDLAAPAGWRDEPGAWRLVTPWSMNEQRWAYEKWTGVRTTHQEFVVFRVTGVGARRVDRSLISQLAPYGSHRFVSVRASVLPARRAAALVGRQVHRARTNAALAGMVGFRRRATSEEVLRRLEQREVDVARGRALVAITVFVVVAAATRLDVEQQCEHLLSDARRSGVTLERGDGRHALWLCSALPGSPT